MADPYDGLCGIPARHPIRGGRYLRCQHGFGHGGEHSWAKHEDKLTFKIFGGITVDEIIRRAYTKDSPAAQAMLHCITQNIKD